MDVYEYKGRNKRGELMQGTVESPSQDAVAAWLLGAGISPTQIRLQRNQLHDQPEWLRRLQRGGSVRSVDLLLFTRQMGTMVRAGVPLMQALAGIQKSASSPALIDVLQAIRADLDKGVELSAAMSRHPKLFNDYYVSMVRVGEGSGRLEESFRRLFEQIEFDHQMKQKIKGALRYPSFVLVAIAIAMAVMTLFVIPVFAKTFSNMNASLPALTLLLLAVSDFAVNYWWAVLAMMGSGFYAFTLHTRSPEGRYAWDKLKLRFPVIGRIMVKASIGRFCRSFATASQSGVPIVQAFTLVSRVVDNAFYEERILLMRDGVERGESMLRVAQTAGIFTPLEIQMIAVGEETGDIDGMLNQVADIYQEEVEYEVSRLSQSIEPILLAFMGGLVGILMLGIFLPMWDLGQVALHKR